MRTITYNGHTITRDYFGVYHTNAGGYIGISNFELLLLELDKRDGKEVKPVFHYNEDLKEKDRELYDSEVHAEERFITEE